jgi:hypothetical protein
MSHLTKPTVNVNSRTWIPISVHTYITIVQSSTVSQELSHHVSVTAQFLYKIWGFHGDYMQYSPLRQIEASIWSKNMTLKTVTIIRDWCHVWHRWSIQILKLGSSIFDGNRDRLWNVRFIFCIGVAYHLTRVHCSMIYVNLV